MANEIRKAFEEEKHKQGFPVSKWSVVLNQYQSLHDQREYIMYKSRQQEIDALKKQFLEAASLCGTLQDEIDGLMEKMKETIKISQAIDNTCFKLDESSRDGYSFPCCICEHREKKLKDAPCEKCKHYGW